MANCPSYDCGQDFPSYTIAGCSTKYKGGANAAVFIRCGSDVADPSDGTEINALITAGNAVVVNNLKINWDAPSAVTTPSYVGCVPDTLATQDWSITVIDRNVTAEASDFYGSIIRDFGGELGGIIIRDCGSTRVHYFNEALTMAGGPVMPDQDTDIQRYELTLTCRSDDFPTIADVPAGVFT